MPDPKAALSNIHESLVNGGHFAPAVWASPDKVPFIFVPMNTVLKETNSQAPPPGTPGPFSTSDQNSLKNFYVSSGFKEPAIEMMNVVCKFDSCDQFTIFTSEHAGPVLQKMLAAETNERRWEILKAVSKQQKNMLTRSQGTSNLKMKLYSLLVENERQFVVSWQ